MELSKQRILNNMECFVKVYQNGDQVPFALFKFKELKPLEIFFNTSDQRLNLDWHNSFSSQYKTLEEQVFELRIDSDKLDTLQQYSLNNTNLLANKLDKVNNFILNDSLLIKDEYFFLELAKYYNAEILFSIFGYLNSQFNEIRIIEQDQVSITIRKSKSLVSEYFTGSIPLIIDTSELLFYFSQWFNFINDWKSNKIQDLTYKSKNIEKYAYWRL